MHGRKTPQASGDERPATFHNRTTRRTSISARQAASDSPQASAAGARRAFHQRVKATCRRTSRSAKNTAPASQSHANHVAADRDLAAGESTSADTGSATEIRSAPGLVETGLL